MEICRIKNKKEKKEDEEEDEEEDYKIYGILFSIYNRIYDTTVIVYEKQYTSPMSNREIEASQEFYNRLNRSREQSSLIYVYVHIEVALAEAPVGSSLREGAENKVPLKLTRFMWWPANEQLIPWKTITSLD